MTVCFRSLFLCGLTPFIFLANISAAPFDYNGDSLSDLSTAQAENTLD